MTRILKPNQEREKKEIEQILLNNYSLPCKVEIFSEDLRSLDIPLKYHSLLIKSKPKYSSIYFNLRLNEELKKFGIENIFYQSD